MIPKVTNEIADALRTNILNPRAAKASSGDGECGLYALTHAMADFCALAEENASFKPGDADLRLKYTQFKEKLTALVLPAYQAQHKGATLAQFIEALRKADPKVREAEFSPFFRNILANKVHLANMQGNNLHVDELGYILQELSLRGRIYSMNAQNKGQYYDVGDPNNTISYIKLINHQNKQWEWIAKSPADAKAHNDKFRDAKDAKKPGLFDDNVFAKLPEDTQNFLKQMGITEDSGIGKLMAILFNALSGFVKTASKLFNPDQPLEGEELQIPGAASMASAIAALGKNGLGLNQALRKAAMSDNKEENLKAVFDDAVQRLIANKQYKEADALLKSQESVVIDALKTSEDVRAQMAAGMYKQTVTEISATGLAPEMSDEFRQQNFGARLEMLNECYRVNQEIKAIDAAPEASNQTQFSDARINAARAEARKFADKTAAKTATFQAGGQKLFTLYNRYSGALAAERKQQAERAAGPHKNAMPEAEHKPRRTAKA